MSGQQLYAKIKRSSKYYSKQAPMAKADPQLYGWPFPVSIEKQKFGDHVVQGGPGGQYRLSDVNLFVVDNDQEIRIS